MLHCCDVAAIYYWVALSLLFRVIYSWCILQLSSLFSAPSGIHQQCISIRDIKCLPQKRGVICFMVSRVFSTNFLHTDCAQSLRDEGKFSSTKLRAMSSSTILLKNGFLRHLTVSHNPYAKNVSKNHKYILLRLTTSESFALSLDLQPILDSF